jgi:hypothetical protein
VTIGTIITQGRRVRAEDSRGSDAVRSFHVWRRIDGASDSGGAIVPRMFGLSAER